MAKKVKNQEFEKSHEFIEIHDFAFFLILLRKWLGKPLYKGKT